MNTADKYEFEEQIVTAFLESGEWEYYIDPILTPEERLLEMEKLSIDDIPPEFIQSWMDEYSRKHRSDWEDWMNGQREE